MTESSILLTIRLGQEAYDALAIFLFLGAYYGT